MNRSPLWRRLVDVARAGATATYAELGGDRYRGRALATPLTDLMAAEHRAGRPLLSVLCVRADTGRPGAGFLRWVAAHDGGSLECSCGRPLRRSHESDNDYIERETGLTWDFWQETDSEDDLAL